MIQSGSDKLTIEDIEARRKRLKALGAEDSMVGRLNDSAGKLVGTRDQIQSQAKEYLANQVGLSGLTGGAGAAGSSAATGALSSAGMGAAAAAL